MKPTLKRAVTSLAACTLTAAAFGTAASTVHADAFSDRADQLVATYGDGGAFWSAYPANNLGAAQSEWGKSVFYSSLAVFRQKQIEQAKPTPDPAVVTALHNEAVSRLDAGLGKGHNSNQFGKSAVVDLWQRTTAVTPTVWTAARLVDVQKTVWAGTCWDKALTTDPNQTGNHRMMLYTAALFGATDPTVNARPSSSSCATTTLATFVNRQVVAGDSTSYEGAKAWLSRFMDETVRYGFPESDSPTYAGYYLSTLRLIADKYGAHDAAFADKANKTFEWIVANNAGEWNTDGLTATTSRQYFTHDGTAARHGSLGGFLRVVYGGTYVSHLQWEAVPLTPARKAWTITAVALAHSSWRPDARLVQAATERSEAFQQRETTRQNLNSTASGAPPVGRSTRTVAPGVASMATTSSSPTGWGGSQAQEFTFRTHNATATTNRTLAIAAPGAQALPDADDPSVNGKQDLQWLQSGSAAVGVSWSTVSTKSLRAYVGTSLQLQSSTAPNWRIYRADNALVAFRFVNVPQADNPPTPGAAPFNTMSALRSNNPAGAPGNFVIVETTPYVDASSLSTFNSQLTTRNASITCTGIDLLPTCSTATPRTTVQYTSIEGRVLKIGFPGTTGVPQRWIDNVLQDDANWPVLENPWLQQNPVGKPGSDVLRASAVTGGSPASTTTVTQYRVQPWTTTTATPTFATGADGRFESFTGSAPDGFQAANWSGAAGSYAISTTKHTGNTGARVSLAGYGNAGFSLLAANRPAPTKQRATITAWLKTTGVSTAATHGAYVSAQWINAAGTAVCDEQTSDPVNGTTAGWVSRSVTLPPKAGCAGAVKASVSLRLRSNAGGAVVFDDADWADHD